MAIKIPIISEFSPKGIKSAIAQFKQLEGGAAKTAFIMKKAFLPAAAAIGAASAAAFDAVKAAAADQASQIKLAKSLQNTTGATDEQIAAIEKQITAMQMATGIADTDLRDAYARLTQAGMSAATAQDVLTTAIDVSRGTGKDLGSVVLGLSKAYNGQFTTLSKMGIKFSATTLKTKDFGRAIDDLTGAFGGQASAYAGTFAGRMDILRERFSELWETLGTKLLPVFEKMADYITRLIDVANEKGLAGALKTGLGDAVNYVTHASDGSVNGLGRFFNAVERTANAITHGVNAVSRFGEAITGIDMKTFGTGKTLSNLNKQLYDTELTFGASKNYIKDLGGAFEGLAVDIAYATGEVGRFVEGWGFMTQAALTGFMGPVASRDLDEFADYVNNFSKNVSSIPRSVGGALDAVETPLQKFLRNLGEVKAGITDTFKGIFDLGGIYGESKNLKQFMGSVKGIVKQIKDYGANLLKLRDLGLSPIAIQDIMNMDLASGAQLAQDLVNDSGNIKQLNTAYSTIGQVATSVGEGLALGQATGQVTQYITITNPNPKAVVQQLREYGRNSGPLPIAVTGSF